MLSRQSWRKRLAKRGVQWKNHQKPGDIHPMKPTPACTMEGKSEAFRVNGSLHLDSNRTNSRNDLIVGHGPGMEHQYFRPPIKLLKKVEAIEFSTGCGGLSLGAGFFRVPQRSVSSFGGWNSNCSLGEGAVADRQSLFCQDGCV